MAAILGPGGPVVAGDQLRRDSTALPVVSNPVYVVRMQRFARRKLNYFRLNALNSVAML